VAQSWCYVAIQIPDRQNVGKMKEKCWQNESKMSTKWKKNVDKMIEKCRLRLTATDSHPQGLGDSKHKYQARWG
jgi:hypothetical protein